MATGVDELLDMLFQMIDEAKNVPLSGDKCMVERDKALDLLDEIRAQFPMELAEAKKLLSQNKYTVTEIAFMLNFNSVHYFSRQFKDQTDMSPTEYANSIKADNVL